MIQYITGFGMTDIDDLILNSLGALAGVSLYTRVFKKFRGSFGSELAAFVFLTIFGCCGFLSLWLYSSAILTIPDQVNYVNQEILGGVHITSSDLSAECIKIETWIVYLI